MTQELECEVENSHRRAAQYDPDEKDFLHLRIKSLPCLCGLSGCFQDGKFHSAEKCTHFSG